MLSNIAFVLKTTKGQNEKVWTGLTQVFRYKNVAVKTISILIAKPKYVEEQWPSIKAIQAIVVGSNPTNAAKLRGKRYARIIKWTDNWYAFRCY